MFNKLWLSLSLLSIAGSPIFTGENLPQGLTEITARQVLVETAGAGEDLRQEIEELGKKIATGNLENCASELDRLRQAVQKLLPTEKDQRWLSVSADAQFTDFIAKNSAVKVRRASWSVQKLFFLNVFYLAEIGEVDTALKAIDELLVYAPYCSDAYCERGYLLNRAGKPQDALLAYQKAVELAETYNTERHSLPVALRGIGFSQTSLGNYQEAKIAYSKSLELAPDNQIAIDGLANIALLDNQPKK